MARKSRKNVEAASSAASAEEIKKPFRAGIYARISLETEQTRENGTIEIQIQLVRDYIADTADISAEDVYADSDYSGTNFDRPGFTRMMEDIKTGKINCVIVKDLSRLGRNYVETSNYIERVFPFFHVRFIAVTDDFDSFREGTDLTVPLKNIINEFYARDIAKKSSSAKIALFKARNFVNPFEPYGYQKSEKSSASRQLIVDAEVAANVRNMYQWFLDGESYGEIARRLNAAGILSPVLQRKFNRSGERTDPSKQPWNGYEVKRVLIDRRNIGDSVYGRYRHSKLEGRRTQQTIPEEDWLIEEGTHEPIVDREVYWAVKEKIGKKTDEFKKQCRSNCGDFRSMNFYTGKIFCGGCGNRMVLTGTLKNPTYRCGANMNHKTKGNECPWHSARKEDVDYEVLRLVQIHMKAAMDMEGMIREMNSSAGNQTKYQVLGNEVSRLRRELSRISRRKADLYEDYTGRLITEEEYLQFSKIYTLEIEKIKKELDRVLAEQLKYSKDFHLEEGWGKAIHAYMSKRKLTAEMAEAFVESITVHGKYDYEIKLAYDDLFEDLEYLKKEKEKEARKG